MSNTRLLQSLNITIPDRAVSFFTTDEEIVFHVRDLEHDEKHYQGKWHEERMTLSSCQKDKLREHCRFGSWGWQLDAGEWEHTIVPDETSAYGFRKL